MLDVRNIVLEGKSFLIGRFKRIPAEVWANISTISPTIHQRKFFDVLSRGNIYATTKINANRLWVRIAVRLQTRKQQILNWWQIKEKTNYRGKYWSMMLYIHGYTSSLVIPYSRRYVLYWKNNISCENITRITTLKIFTH